MQYKLCMSCGKIFNKDFDSCIKCKENVNLEQIETSINLNEYTKIRYISTDPQFIKEMIELHEKDIVEYTTKMSQLKTLKEQSTQNANIPKCPKCNSTSITTGARGVNGFWGFIGASQTVNRCGNCGHTWKPQK